ncbi:MAG: ComEC/Rec2 family competence protein [Oscillospiraceae bacterium]
MRFKRLFPLLISLLILVGCVDGFSADKPRQNEGLIIDFFNVGQGDCALITLPDERTVLIDSGNNNDGSLLVNRFKSLGIHKIDYFIATHPHEDHIGGADDIINALEVKALYMPNIPQKHIPTTDTYEQFLEAAIANNITTKDVKSGDILLSEENLKISFLAPNGDYYKELNDYSLVTYLKYYDNTVLFMGDAEEISEGEICEKYPELKADIIKVGHHGGESSSTDKFLKLVSPKTAVISCGKKNHYNHPNKNTLKRYNSIGCTIYQTSRENSIRAILKPEGYKFQNNNNFNVNGG